MNPKTYRKMTEKDLKGCRVRVLTELKTYYHTIPAGTICVIERKFNGLWLCGAPCPKCGIQVRVTKVSPLDIELLPKEDQHGREKEK